MYTARNMKAQEAEWRAESDLHTLRAYRELCKDPKRLKAVKDLAKKRVEESADVMAEVAEHQSGRSKD
jgi:hypothetical protein